MVTIKGIVDYKNECDCCGKTNLKRTIAFQNGDADILYYGTSCFANYVRTTEHVNVPGSYTAKNAEQLVEKYNRIQKSKIDFEEAKKDAIKMSLDLKDDISIFKTDNRFYLRTEKSNVGHLFQYPRYTVYYEELKDVLKNEF